MNKELLAPAGDLEAGYAALYYGADAVYLGLQKFSARATAANFNEQDLGELTAYAHSLSPRRKIYAAVNTVVQEKELDALYEALDICSRCGIDGVIVQDLGVAKIVRDLYPELELHASTQMAVHNKEGALALQKFGFKRVVLARELSRREIAEIAAIPNLETEAFIHGALCYSYSGLCMFSSMDTGKSANRGRCLYPCRACFKSGGKEHHYFSMKDMALEEDALKMPAFSLKIEGRKKSALYVAAVTDFYRRLLDGQKPDSTLTDNIKQIFSRPWCRFHFNGRDKNIVDRDFVGHRGLPVGQIESVSGNRICVKLKHRIARHDGIQIDIPGNEKPYGFSLQKLFVNRRHTFEARAGETAEIILPPGAPEITKGNMVYLASSSAVKGAYPYTKPRPGEFKPRRRLNVKLTILPDKISAEADQTCVSLPGNFTPAQNSGRTAEAAQKSFAKTGDTNFELADLQINNPQNLFVPASMFNELRRRLYEAIPPLKTTPRRLPGLLPRTPTRPQWIAASDNIDILSALAPEADELILLINEHTTPEQLKNLPQNKLRLELPAVCRNTSAWQKTITRLLDSGYKKWEAANYWALSALPDKGIDLSFDRQIYILNTPAAGAAAECRASRITLSVEDTPDNWSLLAERSCLPVVFKLYEDVPLFTSAVCIRDNTCKDCPKDKKWIPLEKDGNKYLALSENCQTMVFNQLPFCAAEEAKSIPADFYRADFMYKPYTPEQALAVWKKLRTFTDIAPSLKGNINRTI